MVCMRAAAVTGDESVEEDHKFVIVLHGCEVSQEPDGENDTVERMV